MGNLHERPTGELLDEMIAAWDERVAAEAAWSLAETKMEEARRRQRVAAEALWPRMDNSVYLRGQRAVVATGPTYDVQVRGIKGRLPES